MADRAPAVLGASNRPRLRAWLRKKRLWPACSSIPCALRRTACLPVTSAPFAPFALPVPVIPALLNELTTVAADGAAIAKQLRDSCVTVPVPESRLLLRSYRWLQKLTCAFRMTSVRFSPSLSW